MVIGHAGQVMPGTFNATVFVAAQAGMDRTAAKSSTANGLLRFFIANISLLSSCCDSVKVFCEVRIHQRQHGQPATCPKQKLVQAARSGQSTNLAGLACLRWLVNAPPGKEQRDKRDYDKKWAVRLKPRKVSDPDPAYAESDQNEGAKAARRCQEGCQPSR